MDGPVTADDFLAMDNRMNVNENGTTDEMDWAAMLQEEVQDQHNDADKLGICPIDILSCYWKSSNGKLMLWITGLDGIVKDTVEANNVRIDYPDTLDLYLIRTSIGVKKARLSQSLLPFSWLNWADSFAFLGTLIPHFSPLLLGALRFLQSHKAKSIIP